MKMNFFVALASQTIKDNGLLFGSAFADCTNEAT